MWTSISGRFLPCGVATTRQAAKRSLRPFISNPCKTAWGREQTSPRVAVVLGYPLAVKVSCRPGAGLHGCPNKRLLHPGSGRSLADGGDISPRAAFFHDREYRLYCRLRKISCGFKEHARARHLGEKSQLTWICRGREACPPLNHSKPLETAGRSPLPGLVCQCCQEARNFLDLLIR